MKNTNITIKYTLLTIALIFNSSVFGKKLTGDFAKSTEVKIFINEMTRKHGFKTDYLNSLFSRAKYHSRIIKIMSRSVKHSGVSKGSWNRYRNTHITKNQIERGRKFIRKNKKALNKAEKQFSIPAEYIVAIIGMETKFGSYFGKTSVLSSLATIAFGNIRRSSFFRKELEDFLIMCRQEKLNPLKLKGSFAGAMGYGQFMPSSFRKYMIDFNNDGKKDLWNSTDMIGSIANYFKQHNWQKGKTPAFKATAIGNNFKNIDYGWRYVFTKSELNQFGIKSNKKISEPNLYFIKLRTYTGYDLWIGGHNFYVITRYNNSSKYSMTAFLFAQKLKRYL